MDDLPDLPESTKEVRIPTNPIDMVIGQDDAISIARIAAVQRRNLLLVGPPGIGKSLIAQAMAFLLPRPTQEISVLDNPENPEKPILEIRTKEEIEVERRMPKGVMVKPADIPVFVAERLGVRCKRCGVLSKPALSLCSECGADKYKTNATPFDDIFLGGSQLEDRVYALRAKDGKEDRVLYERNSKGDILFYDEKALKTKEYANVSRKVIVPLNRNNFVQATGASETELLGDVKHDPYGGHPEVGIRPFKRVVPGAIHEAHEGVLFVDELSSIGRLQRFIFTAMQEKKFPISGRNATSSGAVVRVDGVPCDFILVGSLNFGDMDMLLPPLRSRLLGNGYEVLLNTVMPENAKSIKRYVQFIAQEVVKDGRIPHVTRAAIVKIIEEARRRAKIYDGKEGLTLRLRNLSGIIKLAGDSAILEGSEFIEPKHIELAAEKAKTIEQQAQGRYGSLWRSSTSDYGVKSPPEESII
jgi:ATP-dependent Lon protease